MIKPYLPVLAVGVTDITRFSGAHPVFYASIGKAITLDEIEIVTGAI
jgi:hypothetical protein